MLYDKMITFVTSYLFYENHEHISDEFSIENLITLCRQKLPLIVFVYHDCESWIREKLRGSIDENAEMPVLIPIQKMQLRTWRTIQEYDDIVELPKNRNPAKDTPEHLWKTHVAMELVDLAIQQNPFGTRHFAWIQYSLPYVVRNPTMYTYLRDLCNMNFRERCFVFPGCTGSPVTDIPVLLDGICWRFSGGFFIGDSVSIRRGWEVYIREFALFLKTYRKLVWEVNFYAYLEGFCRDDWKVTWYHGNHNDSIISGIPPECFVRCLVDSVTVKTVEYTNMPEIPGFYPTSASYLQYYGMAAEKPRHYLNTRYVNYWLYPNGYYRYSSSDHVIENKNVVCELDADMMPIAASYRIMEDALDLPHFEKAYSRGLEDLRLYEIDGKIKCSATNLNHVDDSGRSRIIVGDYCLDTGTICIGVVVQPPTETRCEKNWIPLVKDNTEYFIYKWFPFEIGRLHSIENGKQQLVIETSWNHTTPMFSRVRGSSPFVETHKGWVGVVHFSYESSPRRYFHILVLLDRNTLLPVSYSNYFVFRNVSIEFCVGFAVESETYTFWISNFDRDSEVISVGIHEIPLLFDFCTDK